MKGCQTDAPMLCISHRMQGWSGSPTNDGGPWWELVREFASVTGFRRRPFSCASRTEDFSQKRGRPRILALNTREYLDRRAERLAGKLFPFVEVDDPSRA
jgi:hypothetical protein